MKSTIAYIQQWGKEEKIIITYNTQEELESKMLILEEEFGTTVSYNYYELKLRTI